MTVSTTLQSKILRTKKRLSDNSWLQPKILISVMGLLAILAFLQRSISIPASYGVITTEIPVLSVPLEDPNFFRFKENPVATIDSKTPIVIMTLEAIFFGNVRDFTEEMLQVRNKYKIPHHNNAPDLHTLSIDLHKWTTAQMNEKNLNHHGVLLFLPADQIPMVHVAQTIATLKKMSTFNRVLLAGGLL